MIASIKEKMVQGGLVSHPEVVALKYSSYQTQTRAPWRSRQQDSNPVRNTKWGWIRLAEFIQPVNLKLMSTRFWPQKVSLSDVAPGNTVKQLDR